MRQQFYLTVGKRDLVGGSLRLSDTGISGTAILGARHKHLASRRLVLLLLLLGVVSFCFLLVRARVFFGYGEELLFSFFLSLSSGNIIVKSRRFFTYVFGSVDDSWNFSCCIESREFFDVRKYYWFRDFWLGTTEWNGFGLGGVRCCFSRFRWY